MERELAGGPARARRVTLLERGPRWRLISLLAGLLVAVTAIAVVLWLTGRQGRSPEETARLFLSATSCAELHTLADAHGDALLRRDGCGALIDAAQGHRTYGDRRADRNLERTLSVGDAMITGNRAEVTVTVSYVEDGRSLPSERIGVMLVRHHEWLVSDWGLRT